MNLVQYIVQIRKYTQPPQHTHCRNVLVVMEKSIPLMIHSYIELLHTKKHYSKHECVQGSQSTPELDQNLRPSTSEVMVLVLAIWLFMLTTVVVTCGNFFPLGVRAVMLVEKIVFKEEALTVTSRRRMRSVESFWCSLMSNIMILKSADIIGCFCI